MTLLRRHPGPRVGFVLHSYGGAAELIAPLAKLGAYFSFPGSFLQDQKGRQRETFRQVPRDRLLIETDAPDQLPPESCCQFPLPCKSAESGVGLNHPANLPAIYAAAAQFFGEPLEAFAVQIEANFLRLFGGRLGAPLSDRLEVD